MSTALAGLAIEIQIFDGDKLLARQVLDQTKIIVGRIFSADFRVSDPRISRIHALIERCDDGTLRITDLASTHGTFVNGERIVERTISLSDDVKLATLKTKISFVSVAPQAAPPEAEKKPAPTPPPQAAAAKQPPVQVQMGPGGQASAVRVSEPTQIRSLKDTARTRGVLDPAGPTEELEVTVYWEETILNVDHFHGGDARVLIGDGPGNNYVVASHLVPDHFQFIRVKGQTAELFLHANMKGSARIQGRMQTFEELQRSGRSQVTLSGQDIAKIRVGSVNFFLMFVPAPPPIPRAKFFDQGALFWSLQFSIAGMAALLIALGLAYRQPIEGQVQEFPERLRKILVQEYVKDAEKNIAVNEAAEPPPVPKTDAKKVEGKVPKKAETVPDAQMIAKQAHRGGNEGEGARERGKEGKRGLKNAQAKTGITNRPKVHGGKRTQDAPEKARVANKAPGGGGSILDSLRNSGLGAKIAKVAGGGQGSGDGGGAQGNDPLDRAFSGVGGGGIRNGRGSGGSGLQGSGKGGGGVAVGVGGLGTKGFGGGAKGDGNGSIPGKGDFVIGTETAEVTVLGSLTREEIERVVNAHKNEVNFCYQRELQRDPHLSGKLALNWTIVSGGRVSIVKASNNSTGSSRLVNCMRDKVARWVFPSPTGGSQAEVDWTWSFKPGSG